MGIDLDRPDSELDISDTARIDRRRSILAQIEAALLADKLSLEAGTHQAGGSDPYNSGVHKIADTGAWKKSRR
jgi:hypothetical protein